MTSNAKLYGLVLSGGKSTRMGTDKGLIKYHGVPQREYLYDLLSQVCEETFISLREEQEAELPSRMQTIVDLNEFRGPPSVNGCECSKRIDIPKGCYQTSNGFCLKREPITRTAMCYLGTTCF